MSAPDQKRLQAASDRDDVLTPAGLVGKGFSRGQTTSILLALMGSVVFHAGVVLVAPDQFSKKTQAVERRHQQELEVILPDLEEPEPPPEEFVLTNPDIASNPPDETNFFSDRNQQAAQEEETDAGDPSLPSVEEEDPEPNQNIVSSESQLPPLEEEIPASTPGEDEGEAAFESLPERPIPGFEASDEADGLEVPVTEEAADDLKDDPAIGVDLGEGEKMAEMSEESSSSGDPAEEQVKPRPRPVLPQLSRGPVGAREGAAPRVGRVAVDANFSEYGDYLARMIDVIVRQWHILAWDSLQAGEVGTVVTVSFRIDAAGEIHGLEVLHSTASLIATLICQDAIASREPYGTWTSDMKEVLGDEQTISIRFHYR